MKSIGKKTRSKLNYFKLLFLLHHFRFDKGKPPTSIGGFRGEVTVTLTSYPPRFRYLHLTLLSLLQQSVRADRIMLWIAKQDMPLLPDSVCSLQAYGINIRPVDDIRSYKKLIFSIDCFPDDFLAIADDDIFYPRNWLEMLILGYRADRRVIPCWRAHRIITDGQYPLPYHHWEWDIEDNEPCDRIVPTGVGGVLYPPHSLHRDVTERALFTRLCQTSDDLWFYWMARRNGYSFAKIGRKFRMHNWPNSLENGLFTDNLTENDRALHGLWQEFGPPFSL